MDFNRISKTAVAFGTACIFAGCASAPQRTTTVESGGDVSTSAPAVTPANNRTIPTGARLVARLDQSLGTSTSKVGDVFTTTVEHTLYANDGSVVVPAGAQIQGRVTARDDSDHAGDPAVLRLAFDRIRFHGHSYPFSAMIVQSSGMQTTSEPRGDRTRQIIIGGAVGAALGGLISGGDVKDIVIGGAIGAAAGSIVSLGTERNATLPAGSVMTLQTTQTTTIR